MEKTAENDFMTDLCAIVGMDAFSKTASGQDPKAPEGTPAEGSLTKTAGLTKIADMSIEQMMEHPVFREAVAERLAHTRDEWEPIAEELARRTGA